MSKRHLSKQQQHRIQAIQAARTGVIARVTAQLGRQIEVKMPNQACVPATLRQNLPPIVTGDWVLANQETPPVVIEQLLPRDNLIERPTAAGRRKPIAANVDQALLVIAPLPVASTLMIDRYLVQLHALDLPVILIINKSDLGLADLSALMALYRQLGYPVLAVSSLNREIGSLADQLADQTTLVLGQSGVGKSSLIRALDPSLDLRIGDLSQSDQGQHTTTITRLYSVKEAEIMDSPGVYDIATWHLSPEQLRAGFIEFALYKNNCQFKNCTHTHEPICGIKAALADQLIAASRYQHYCSMLKE